MKTNLFLLHFAGGNKYSFNFLKPLLTDDFNFFPLELPGRGQRLGEAFLNNLSEAADDILNQIIKINGSNEFILFGHSLGSVISLIVANKLELLNIRPQSLIMSGNAGPGVREDKDYRSFYKLPDEEFIDELKAMGGLPDELVESKTLMDFFLPIIRADFALFAKDEPEYQPVNIPIYAMMGDEERKVDYIKNWKNYTLMDFQYSIFPGKHFFIYENAEKIADTIRSSVRTTASKKYSKL